MLIADLESVIDRARDRSEAVGADRDILVWKMAVFGNPASVEEMIGKARGYKALVLDLRGTAAVRLTRCASWSAAASIARFCSRTNSGAQQGARARREAGAGAASAAV